MSTNAEAFDCFLQNPATNFARQADRLAALPFLMTARADPLEQRAVFYFSVSEAVFAGCCAGQNIR